MKNDHLILILFLIAGMIFIVFKWIFPGANSWWKSPQKKHWVTTAFGIATVLFGLWSLHVHWVPSQNLYFNLVYAGSGPIAIIVAGIIGLVAADGRHVK